MPKPRPAPAPTPAAGPVPPAVSAYMAKQQAKSAASLRGTETARVRASKGGSSVSPEAAHLRAIKAAAARYGRPGPGSASVVKDSLTTAHPPAAPVATKKPRLRKAGAAAPPAE